jgi:hypothetical protein
VAGRRKLEPIWLDRNRNCKARYGNLRMDSRKLAQELTANSEGNLVTWNLGRNKKPARSLQWMRPFPMMPPLTRNLHNLYQTLRRVYFLVGRSQCYYRYPPEFAASSCAQLMFGIDSHVPKRVAGLRDRGAWPNTEIGTPTRVLALF